jgi:hypothetical protein
VGWRVVEEPELFENLMESEYRYGFAALRGILLAGLFLACNQPFDPRGGAEPKPIVFSVLSTDRNLQFVRVERSYMPVGSDPLQYAVDGFVPNATVTVNDGNITVRFHDTTLSRSDTSRFKFPLRAYCFGPFVPRYGIQYEVTVQTSELGTATGKVTVPTGAKLAFGATASDVMDYPGSHQKSDAIPVEILLSDVTKGYIGRLFIDYTLFRDGQWIGEHAEVPVRFKYSGTKDFRWVTYAQFTRRPTGHSMILAYNNEIYNFALIDIAYTKYPTNKIVFNRIVFQFVQIEQNLYDYYLLAHAFEDPQSTRLDQPEYTNVAGGDGVIGAYTLDSIAHQLPENFFLNRR